MRPRFIKCRWRGSHERSGNRNKKGVNHEMLIIVNDDDDDDDDMYMGWMGVLHYAFMKLL